MTMPDPIGGRRRDDPSDAGSAVPVMSPWDLVFERLDRLERTQSDMARMVLKEGNYTLSLRSVMDWFNELLLDGNDIRFDMEDDGEEAMRVVAREAK